MIAWLKARAALVEENRLLKYEVARRDYILSGFAKYEEAVRVYRAKAAVLEGENADLRRRF